ncbi:amp dependent CoA ligase [Fistulina hepatica ATCC 64428]|uniref:Amp dependent CoA ligase n=1 Tax=Fistulina hepatica ATCC 64428 TaxID=1128425 RepID=A0A0D7AIZ8_9AGAR|nr:amp dependent CoA ligase [Fistulina hepatica ATCC 64428]
MRIYKSLYPVPPPAPDRNVHEFLFERPEQAAWPDFTIYIDEATGEKTTFRAFKERVLAAATFFRRHAGLDLRDDDMVGIMCENSSGTSLVIHALLAAAVPFVLLPAFGTVFEAEYAARLCTISRLFVSKSLLAPAMKVASKVGLSPSRVYVVDRNADDHMSLRDMIETVYVESIPIAQPRLVKAGTLAYLVLSSGTSGAPKGVMVTHGNVIYASLQHLIVGQATAAVALPSKLSTPEGIPLALAVLPMYHTYGLHLYCFRPCLIPSTCIFVPRWNLKRALQTVQRYQITHMALVPSMMLQLVNSPLVKPDDLQCIIVVNCGGAYLPPEVVTKLRGVLREGFGLVNGYGMSEGTISAIQQPSVNGLLDGAVRLRPEATGILLPGLEARLVQDGKDVDDGAVGELWLRGSSVVQGYWNDERATKATFCGGWLRTGDRFHVEDGIYFLCVLNALRAEPDTLKVSGVQVSPKEIEDVLLAHPDKLIVDASVAGVSGGRISDEKVPRAWVVLSDAGARRSTDATIKSLDDWHRQMLSKQKWLRGGIEVVTAIPKTPTGKSLRRVLQEQHERRTRAQAKL